MSPRCLDHESPNKRTGRGTVAALPCGEEGDNRVN